jgi:hypothetical protein
LKVIISGISLTVPRQEPVRTGLFICRDHAARRYHCLDKGLSPSVVAGGWGQSHNIIYLEIELDERKRVGIGIDMRLRGSPGDGHVIKELLG